MADPIRNSMKYIAELFQTGQWSPRLAIADSVYSRQYNIYAFSIAPLITDPANYWIVWGGEFDNSVGGSLQIYMGQFLTEVFLPSNLEVTENSFYIDESTNICYMNIPQNPWRYFPEYASVYGNFESTFATSPKNENNPSDCYYDITKVEVRMEVPSLESSLNEIISGISTYDVFSITIDNSDGAYDGVNILSYFNTPLQISKSASNPQYIPDFDRVRYGIIQDITVGFDKMEITAADQFYNMNTDFCPKFSVAEFANIDTDKINEDIPVGWGVLEGIEPIEVDRDTSDPCEWIDYIALDKDYIASVQKVYDADGNELTHAFTAGTGIIRVTEVDTDGNAIEAEYMNVTGKAACNIGEIITEALAGNENLSYIEGIWDLTETNEYIALCPDTGTYFSGGTTKDLVTQVLKNDMSYLIQKNDGRLTIRRWGEDYTNHQLESWVITGKPKKNFADATKYFCSTAKVNYNRFEIDDRYQNNYVDDSLEKIIFGKYRKSYLAEFPTDLKSEAAATDLADRIMERFGEVRPTIEVDLGVNTFDVNLLDTIDIELEVGEPARVFSEYSRWIVKKIDPGQDRVVLEGQKVFYNLTFDDVQATLDGYNFIVEVN
ncbi:MAG: hypothetical protein WC900_01895 [Oscillospiraceae bacterium]|jgi:hypothetical protein